mgnify:CR=1 FL=1
MPDSKPTVTSSSPPSNRGSLERADLAFRLLQGGLLGNPLNPPSREVAQYYLQRARQKGFDPRAVWESAVRSLQQAHQTDPPWTWEEISQDLPNLPSQENPAPTSPTE